MNYYEILGLQYGCTIEEIKSSYKKLALKYHPDKGGDSDYFTQIVSAYETLSNPEKKLEYDNKSSFNKFYGRYSRVFGKSNTAKDFGLQATKVMPKGDDIYTDVYFESLDEVVDLKYRRYVQCQVCSGTKYKSFKFVTGIYTGDEICDHCKGNGVRKVDTEMKVKLPSDVDFDQTYTIKGKGSFICGGISGDLILNIKKLEK